MDNLVTLLVAVAAICAVGFVVYRVTRKSGSSTLGGGYTRPGKSNRDSDLR